MNITYSRESAIFIYLEPMYIVQFLYIIYIYVICIYVWTKQNIIYKIHLDLKVYHVWRIWLSWIFVNTIRSWRRGESLIFQYKCNINLWAEYANSREEVYYKSKLAFFCVSYVIMYINVYRKFTYCCCCCYMYKWYIYVELCVICIVHWAKLFFSISVYLAKKK